MFDARDIGCMEIRGLGIRPDCDSYKGRTFRIIRKKEADNSITINKIVDGTKIKWK